MPTFTLNSKSPALGTTKSPALGTTRRPTLGTTRRQATIDACCAEGAAGDYQVFLEGNSIPITAAIAVRVLPNGELNLLTDEGRWFLFAPDTWKYVIPAQPEPRKPREE